MIQFVVRQGWERPTKKTTHHHPIIIIHGVQCDFILSRYIYTGIYIHTMYMASVSVVLSEGGNALVDSFRYVRGSYDLGPLKLEGSTTDGGYRWDIC